MCISTWYGSIWFHGELIQKQDHCRLLSPDLEFAVISGLITFPPNQGVGLSIQQNGLMLLRFTLLGVTWWSSCGLRPGIYLPSGQGKCCQVLRYKSRTRRSLSSVFGRPKKSKCFCRAQPSISPDCYGKKGQCLPLVLSEYPVFVATKIHVEANWPLVEI